MSVIDFSKADRTAVLFRSLTDETILYVLYGLWSDFTRKFHLQFTRTRIDKNILKSDFRINSLEKNYAKVCLNSIAFVKTEIAKLPKTKQTAKYIQSAGLGDVDIYSPHFEIPVFIDGHYDTHYDPKAILKIFGEYTPGTIFTEDWN